MFTDPYEANLVVQERERELRRKTEETRIRQGLKEKPVDWQIPWRQVALILTSLLTKAKLN
jgi:hypothetical protein